MKSIFSAILDLSTTDISKTINFDIFLSFKLQKHKEY